jgi:hypothetical protein
VLAGVKPVDAEQHRLAIDHERARPVLQRGLDDQRVMIGPIVAVPGEQPHTLALALDEKALAIVLDLVDPVRARGNLGSARWNTRFELPFGHGG